MIKCEREKSKMTCNDCIHIAVCYRYSHGLPVKYANKCGNYEPSRPKGHWINIKIKDKWKLKCSECNQIYDISFRDIKRNIVYNSYCPKCGAEMENIE